MCNSHVVILYAFVLANYTAVSPNKGLKTPYYVHILYQQSTDRFSKFFHWHTPWKIFIKYLTSGTFVNYACLFVRRIRTVTVQSRQRQIMHAYTENNVAVVHVAELALSLEDQLQIYYSTHHTCIHSLLSYTLFAGWILIWKDNRWKSDLISA